MLKEENYSKAYVEVIEIIKHMNKEDVDKIPQNFKNMLEKNKDKNYTFEIDESIILEELNFMKETKAILAYMFVNYWSSPEEKKFIMEKFRNDINTAEELKKEKYTTELYKNDDVNKKIKTDNQIEETEENIEEKNVQLTESKKENIIIKLLKKIKNLFKSR